MKRTAPAIIFIALTLAILSAVYITTASLPSGRCEAYPGYPGPCPDVVQPPLEYPKPTFINQCWIVNDTWSKDTFLQFTVVQDMPKVDYTYFWGKHIDYSRIELQMSARTPPFPRQFFDRYVQFHSKRETLPGIYRLKWQGSNRVSSAYLYEPGVEYQVDQAYLQFQDGSNFPCYSAPCVVPLARADGSRVYPLMIDTYEQVDIGECLDWSTLTEVVFLAVIEE